MQQNYTVTEGGHVDVCVKVGFSADDAKKLAEAGITQKRTILDLSATLPNMVDLAATIRKGLLKIAADPQRRREVARLKAESQMAAIVAKLEAIAKIEEKLATETDPAKVAALESKLVKLA